MDCNICEISNTVMIDSLDAIIQQENWKLEMDKNTGLLAKKSKTPKVNFNLSSKFFLTIIYPKSVLAN